jgi:hypothetical protein
MLARLTLVSDEEGHRGRTPTMRGATAVAIGLIGFAVIGSLLFACCLSVAAICVASAGWVVGADIGYGVVGIAGVGADEQQ